MERRAPPVVGSGTISSETLIGTIAPGAPFVLGIDVSVDAIATIEVRSPLGAVVWTTTTAGAARVTQTWEAAILPAYRLYITPAAGCTYSARMYASA